MPSGLALAITAPEADLLPRRTSRGLFPGAWWAPHSGSAARMTTLSRELRWDSVRGPHDLGGSVSSPPPAAHSVSRTRIGFILSQGLGFPALQSWGLRLPGLGAEAEGVTGGSAEAGGCTGTPGPECLKGRDASLAPVRFPAPPETRIDKAVNKIKLFLSGVDKSNLCPIIPSEASTVYQNIGSSI